MSAIDAIYDYSVSTTEKRSQQEKADISSGKVSHTDFLKLLVKQLTTQDPLNPMQDIDFTAQLAQLQALDEQIAMTKTMQAMRQDSQMQAGSAMIGKYVSGIDRNGDTALGVVTRIVQSDGEIYLQLGNGQQLSVTSIANVWNENSGLYDKLSLSGNIIGMWVEAGTDPATQQPINGIVEKVVVNGGEVQLRLFGGSTIDWSQIRELRAPTDDELWYVLPDDVRQMVEKARGMITMVVTGMTDAGETVTGIVSNAELNGSDVYLLLYNGKRVKVNTVIDAPRDPDVDDVRRDMIGLWVTGLDSDANSISGVVVGAMDRDYGITLVLDNGNEVYFDTLSEVREATAAEQEGAASQNDGSGVGAVAPEDGDG